MLSRCGHRCSGVDLMTSGSLSQLTGGVFLSRHWAGPETEVNTGLLPVANKPEEDVAPLPVDGVFSIRRISIRRIPIIGLGLGLGIGLGLGLGLGLGIAFGELKFGELKKEPGWRKFVVVLFSERECVARVIVELVSFSTAQNVL